MPSISRELAVLDEASRLLAEAQSLDEVKAIRDKAEAIRTFAKAARLGLELQNRAAELKLRAERKAGAVIGSLKLHGGDRKSCGHNARLKLEDLGVSHDQSKRWQRMAAVPEDVFRKYLCTIAEQQREITSAGLLRLSLNRALRKPPHPAFPHCETTPHPMRAGDPPEEILQEVINHCQLLAEVLRPLYEGGPAELKTGERRVVGRLIREMSELLAQLRTV